MSVQWLLVITLLFAFLPQPSLAPLIVSVIELREGGSLSQMSEFFTLHMRCQLHFRLGVDQLFWNTRFFNFRLVLQILKLVTLFIANFSSSNIKIWS
ncbi:hypothetical protein K439DRAFT_1121292 [Ramaria rubella]|nr:hypothetical protein K439DRAFT_1121292 [Ramaria rubella]